MSTFSPHTPPHKVCPTLDSNRMRGGSIVRVCMHVRACSRVCMCVRVCVTQAQNPAGIGGMSMAMAAPNMLDDKALALPNVKTLRRQLTY